MILASPLFSGIAPHDWQPCRSTVPDKTGLISAPNAGKWERWDNWRRVCRTSVIHCRSRRTSRSGIIFGVTSRSAGPLIPNQRVLTSVKPLIFSRRRGAPRRFDWIRPLCSRQESRLFVMLTAPRTAADLTGRRRTCPSWQRGQ